MVVADRQQSHPSPPYSGPLEEVAPPQAEGVRVRFACPYCGEVLERLARLDETRWYLSGCGFGHSGIGIRDPNVQRVKAY
jgi:predicted RNA-binding Zn-ribbon protein involved in translation (DUF1610 family)